MKNTKAYPGRFAALAAVTMLLTINFWAWSLISPLASGFGDKFGLAPFSTSMLVAAPVLIGSLGRIPVGLAADRFGGRRVFSIICILAGTITFGFTFASSYGSLLAGALCLGLAGASFAAGVPFVRGWFPKKESGFALGIYAVGNAGTAVSGLLTTRLVDTLGQKQFFTLLAVLLISAGAAFWLRVRENPSWRPVRTNAIQSVRSALGWKLTVGLSVYYGLTFGAFVALGLYLPVLLKQSHGLTATDAAARAAGFVLLATAFRPVGGWLSDKFSGMLIIRMVCFGIAVLGFGAALSLKLMPYGTIVFLMLAATLGIGNGAVFAVIGHRCPPKFVGTVTGLISAAGAIGGYFPPLIMGLSFQLTNSYSMAFAAFALAGLVGMFSARRLLPAVPV